VQYFTVKPNQGFVATSFKAGDSICMGPFSLLHKQMFLDEDKPKAPRYYLFPVSSTLSLSLYARVPARCTLATTPALMVK
jgi:hypothetical protein